MANLMNIQELEKYISNDEVLSQVYSGDYLSKLAAKRFGKEGKQTREAAITMAQRGAARQNVKSTFSKIETEARNLGLEVRYDVNKSKNEITVVFVDKKGIVASEKVGLGTTDRTLKNNMAAQKMFGGHISDRGATLLTQTEEVALSFLETLKKTSQLKTSKVDKRDFLKTQLRAGKKEAEKSVVTSETYSFIEDDEFNVRNMPSSSKERDIMQGGIIKVGGIIGEVSKGVDFLSELRKKNKISKKQAEAKNQRVGQYMTEYVATYQTLGEKIAEERFITSMMNEGLDLSEKMLQDKTAEMKRQFGEFLQMKPSIGLSKDEAFKNKKFVYGGVNTAAFRTFLTTGRHLGQTPNYLEKSQRGKRQSAKRLDEIFVASNGEDMRDTEHKLYTRALVSDENAVLSALKVSIEAEIAERQENFKGSKRYKKMSKQERADELKKIDAEVRTRIPEINAAILEDMGLTKESVMREQESWRDVTGTITEKEYQKYKDIAIEKLSKQAEKEYKKLSDEKKAAQTQEDFTNKYISSHKTDLDRIIAEKATGRKGLSIANIEQWETEGGEIGYDIKAKEIIGGNVGKLLWLRTGLRETARGINDRIFQRMTKILGVEGADVIGLTKKIKAEEIPGYAQAILTQQIVNASNEKKAEILAKLGSLGFNIIEKNGKYYVDNSMEQVEKQDWDGLVDYLTDDLKVFEREIDKDSGKATYKFAMNTANIRALQFMDVANRADVWEPTKDVKLGYKEASAALREVSAAGLSGEQKESLVKDLKIMYDPTKGRTGGVAQKAQKDRDAILNKDTGSIVRTYESKTKQPRAADVATLRGQSYSRGTTIDNKDQTYVITIGNGSGYSINVNDLLKNKAVWDKSGGLTEEEYRKTIWGVIDAAKQELIKQGVSPENIQAAIDPGTDFGFEMFNEDGKGGGAVGRFIYLPNIETDVRYDGDEALYELPEYSQDVNSLIGSMKRGVAKSTVKPKAQAVVQKIFATAQSEKSSLGEKALKKRFGASKAGKVTEISRSKINELIAQGDEEAANRLMSAVYVSRAAGLNMLRDRDKYISVQDGKEIYNREEHGAFLTAALKYLKGDDIVKTLYGSKEALSEETAKEKFAALNDEEKDQLIQKLVGEVATAITDTSFSGKVKGLSGIANRFPSLQKHAALFGEMLISDSLESAEIRMGPAMTKVLNGDYDGDTVNFILGLWSSGMSFDAAAKLVERQKKINRRFYDKMLKSTAGSDDAISGSDISRLKDTESMGLSALATKFNKPFTGIFSNMSTRIREGLKALGRDYIDEQGNVKDLSTQDDYVDAIRTELVTAVGQILEQDSISAKKVDERISKLRELKGGAITEEDKKQIELNTLNEFKDLENMIRDENSTYEDIINKLGEMGLVGGDATQITGVVTSVIEELIDDLDDDTRNKILKKVGISEDELSSGKISKDTFLKAGKDLESNLFDESGKWYKIFSGTFGSGLATSRTFTPFMKGDPYQLFKFLKETNNLLRETGEIIDENGKKFTEYGESINKTHSALSGEAVQEQAKVVIAGKEGKAIERNANIYQQLSEKLEAAGNNYKEINRLSTSELKSRLLPYAGQQTTGLDQKTLSKLSRKARRGEILSKEELAAAFGVKDEAALNSLFMGTLSTRRGEYIHNLAQGDKKGARAKKKEIADLFKVFGYSDEQIQDTFGIYNLGAKNVKSITKKFGKSMGAEIPFIGMTSDGQYVINARSDELFYKQRTSPWDKTKKEDVITLVDYKTHTGGKISDEDTAQGIIYKTFLEEFRDFAKKVGKDISDEDAAEMFRKQIGQGMKYTSDTEERQKLLSRVTPELVGILRGGAAIEANIVVVDSATGAAQAYAIGQDRDKYKQISNMLLSGDTSPLTAEQKTVLKGGAKQLTSADYFKPGLSSEQRKSIEDQTKSAISNEQRNESQKEYNTLVSEEFKLKKEIAALDKERWKLTDIEGKKSTDYTVQNLDAEKQWRQDELKRMQDRKTELEGLGAIESKATTASNEEKMTAYLMRLGVGADGKMALTPEEQADYWSQYERALDKQARVEEEIFGIRNKAQTSYGTEKNLLYQIADEKEKALATDKANVAMLEKIVGKLDPTRLANIKEQVALNQQLYKLQALKQTRGATSIWDVMTNDIRRATMRVADFGIAAKILNKIPQDIQKVIQYTKELDAAMTNIRVVTGASAEEAKTLARGYTQLAKELGVTTVEVANSANEWNRQGYEAEEANNLIIASSKLAKLGMISTTEATKDLTSAIKGFKLSTEDAMSVVDKLTKIDQVAAISAGNLAEGLARVSTTAQQAGLSLDETAAMVTTITEVTQRDASTAGEALRTLISRYSNVKAGVFTSMGEEAEETSGNINDIEKVLGKLGIRIRTSGTEMRSIEDVLDELAEKWDTLDDVSRNAVASAFAGVRQRESFNILLSNWDRVKELTEESANAAGTANEKYSAYMDSMEAATKRLQNAWEGFTQSLETSTVMKFLTNATAAIVENADKMKYLITALAVAGSAKIFDFFTNKGETGGWKGLIANIPFIGRGTKTNNILESIDKKVGNIEKGVGADSLANQTKNGGFFRRIGRFLKNGFGFGDIYDPNSNKSISRKTLKLYKQSQKGKIRLGDDFLGYTKGLTDDERELLRLSATVEREDAKKTMETYNKLLKQRKGQNAAMGAVSAVLTNLFTTKQVGGDVGGFIAKNIVGMGGNEQTIEETESDKLRRTLISGGAAALGGALLGPFGAMLGQTIGEGAASIVSTIVHRSELEMKQQVADAKSRDKQLTNIKESVDSVSLDLGDKTENYETYQKRKKEVDALRGKIDTSDDAVRALINTAAISKGYAGGYDEMLDSLLDTNLSTSQRESIKNDLLYIISSEKAKNYRDTQLIELEKLNKAKAAAENRYAGGFEWLENANLWDRGNVAALFSSGAFQDVLQKGKDLGYITEESFAKANNFGQNEWNIRAVGATADERIANYAKFRDILKEIGKIGYWDMGDYQVGDLMGSAVSFGGKNRLLQNIIDGIDDMIANYNQESKLQSEWQSNFALAGIYGSGLSLMQPSKLKELGLEGSIQEIADFLENNFSGFGLVVRDETGKIIGNVHDDIKKAIKDDETLYNNLIFPQTSIKEWQQNSGKLLNIIDKLGIKTEDKLAAAAEKGGKEFSDLAKSVGLTTTELRSLLNLGSEDYLSEMAKSINLTKEQLLGFAKSVKGLEKIALSAFTLSSSQLTEKFDLMREAYFAALDGSWAGDSELLNKINSDNFIKGFITNINDASQTAKELGEILYTSGQSLEEFLQGFALFPDVMTSGSQMDNFVNYLKETSPALKAVVIDMNNIKEVLDYIANNPEATKDLKDALEQFIQLQEIQKYNEALDKSMQAVIKSNEKQIENLTQQKEALGSINDERKKELEYIKAKDALENARKEKKRVYRAGVGWAYESDDDAIAEASEKIESLDVEKRQDLLQAQINQLEQQNSILENLPNEKELEELKKVLNDLTGATTANVQVIALLVDMYNNPNYKFNTKDYIDNYLKNWKPNAIGNISFHGGAALINELGTEAVITPGGTLTALPSKTGIVPADITRNVWALGEVAPTLVAQLGSLSQKALSGNVGNTTYEEGQYFDNFTMNVYPAKGDDLSKILEQARAQMRLTRHNN